MLLKKALAVAGIILGIIAVCIAAFGSVHGDTGFGLAAAGFGVGASSAAHLV